MLRLSSPTVINSSSHHTHSEVCVIVSEEILTSIGNALNSLELFLVASMGKTAQNLRRPISVTLRALTQLASKLQADVHSSSHLSTHRLDAMQTGSSYCYYLLTWLLRTLIVWCA